ncbi:hypothetical protein E2C01_035755 [Portunus trituberculatus]|uniref:Uncharacterized protein n=1 Tax=Portunus trituberculatus TaxID=210409 RepID=A0A5B7F403_PORTR|nr:hypothetical protein [Portunus trituberculatus]
MAAQCARIRGGRGKGLSLTHSLDTPTSPRMSAPQSLPTSMFHNFTTTVLPERVPRPSRHSCPVLRDLHRVSSTVFLSCRCLLPCSDFSTPLSCHTRPR